MSLPKKDHGPISDKLAHDILDKAFKYSEAFVFRLEYNPKSDHFSLPFASKNLFKILKVTPHELRKNAQKVIDIIHEEDRKVLRELLDSSKTTHDNWKYEFRVLLPNSRVLWFQSQWTTEKPEKDRFIWHGYAVDITDRKHMELDLFENKERLQLALESAKEGLWDWNLKSNKVVYSDESKKLLGCEPHEIGDSPEDWNVRVHKDDIATYYEDIQDHFAGKIPYYSNEHRVLCKDGNYKWILDRGKVIERDAEGNVLRVIGTHSDITPQKTREEIAKGRIETIEQQNAQLKNFAHIVSHNLKSHSGNIETLLEFLKNAKSDKEKQDYIEHLDSVSRTLSDTINHLDDIVSVRAKAKEPLQPISLFDYIENIGTSIKGDLRQKNGVIRNLIPEDLRIHGYPAYVESVFLNLITNALKYAHPTRKPVVILEALHEHDGIKVCVSDNGLGIDLVKFGDRIFGMYQTFHNNKDATGIGLYITKSQIESMGGWIDVESEVDKGSSFTVFFRHPNS